MKLQKYADYVDTYGGRDRIMRILYYSSQLVGGLTTSDKLAQKLDILSDQINSCRTVMRLFDDAPMLCYTLSYGLGKEDPDRLMRFCGLAVNFLDQVYYPLEHVAWAADCKLLKIKSDPWWTASTICWALSMYFMIFKSLRYFMLLRNLKNLVKPSHLNSGEAVLRRLRQAQLSELLTAARCFLDFIHAVHWLPTGFLWAGKLRQWHIGLLGVVSSLISIYQSA
ncbi:peroxisomal membrane protein 11C isoform X1 [Halyomorpha halys]|uniref:peroxisomal membrane protein 11C isoform X1 n=1 Tax=Halyomorpha halys TaxID=286706 RepID=UPI0006D4D5A6|nr:peroxisomal membrane protein 11C isoform X1 [Halyomorpha halys]